MCCKQLTGLVVADRWTSAAGVRRGTAAGGRALVAWDAAAARDWEWERQRVLTGARHSCMPAAVVAVVAVAVAAMVASLKSTTHAARISDVFIMQHLPLMDQVYILNTQSKSVNLVAKDMFHHKTSVLKIKV